MRTTAMTLAIIVPLTTGLTGCVTTGGNDSMLTPAERQLRQTETARLTQGVFTGAIAGALIGGLIMAAAGGDGRQIAAGAGVGALTGGVAGAADAADVNAKARPYAQANTNYESMIKQADANIAAYRRATSAAATIAREDSGRIARLNSQLAKGSITDAQYREKIANARGNIRYLQQRVDAADADLASLNSAAQSGAPVGGRTAELKVVRNNLKGQLDALTKVYDRVPDAVGSPT